MKQIDIKSAARIVLLACLWYANDALTSAEQFCWDACTQTTPCSYTCDPGDHNMITCGQWGVCQTCGDGYCDPEISENQQNCGYDCGWCGNGVCNYYVGENSSSCASDCYCGDGLCETSVENGSNCAADCGPPPTPCNECVTGSTDCGTAFECVNTCCMQVGPSSCPTYCFQDLACCGSYQWCVNGRCVNIIP
jgi:hypothetical protein